MESASVVCISDLHHETSSSFIRLRKVRPVYDCLSSHVMKWSQECIALSVLFWLTAFVLKHLFLCCVVDNEWKDLFKWTTVVCFPFYLESKTWRKAWLYLNLKVYLRQSKLIFHNLKELFLLTFIQRNYRDSGFNRLLPFACLPFQSGYF